MATNTCPECGRPVEEPGGVCPSCMLRQGLGADTVERTGASCTRCESPLDADARFCARCGMAAPASLQASEDPVRRALEDRLGGQYRILRLLGSGGMGAVYLARDLTLEREVAIKVVKPAAGSANVYDRFRREAKTAAQLSHPNIVPLHAFGSVDGMPYFVMGYVRGESLAERLRREGKLSEAEARRILADVALALDHAHRQGVVHRDVKPDNVLLEDATGRALLTDFGVAKSMSRGETLTQHGSVIGTPHYMSPEQAAGRGDIDGRSDIYSLGVMGYAMLAGRLPFDGKSAADVLSKHITQDPPALRSLAPTISESTLQVIERCLAKDPAKRWQDAHALRATLGLTEDGELPDALEAVHGQGVAFAFITAALLMLMWAVVVRMQNAPPAVFGLVGAVVLFGYAVVVVHLRLDGFPIALVQRVIWSEPGWWVSWYPRKLRRRNNVWDRLPRAARLLRAWSPLLFISLAVVALHRPVDFRIKIVEVALFVVVSLALAVAELTTKRQLKRMGIASRHDQNRIAFSAPPSRARFWNQPHIAAILAPPAEGDDNIAVSDSPHAQMQLILRLADELTGPLRPLGADAAAAARRLLASVEEADKQIADLARNVEPGEEQRLVDKIAALAEVKDAAEMRELLEKQLDLIRSLNERIEAARARRSRHVEMLKTLALHMASLRARVPDTPSGVGSLSDDVRALCEEIRCQEANVAAADAPTLQQRRTGT